MNATELRAMSAEQLSEKLSEHTINQLDNPHKITDVKRDIARVMTVINEKNA